MPAGPAAVAVPPVSPPAMPAPRVAPDRQASLHALALRDLRPVPEVPDSGLINAMRYAVAFARARWQRRSVIHSLQADIEENTAALDELLGMLGRRARELRVNSRALTGENAALDGAEQRRERVEQTRAELRARQEAENRAFAEREAEQQARVATAEADVQRVQQERGNLDAQRRGLRDQRKALDRQHRDCLKGIEEREAQAAKADMDDARAGLLQSARELQAEAAALAIERDNLDQRLTEIEAPIAQTAAREEALVAALDAVKRGLQDMRQGHRHQMAEIEAEQGRRNRELSQAEAEIQRRLVTLGMLINLNRMPRPEFDDIYARIDQRRSEIGMRTTAIERLTAERDGYDRSSLVRGYTALGVSTVSVLVLIVLLIALL